MDIRTRIVLLIKSLLCAVRACNPYPGTVCAAASAFCNTDGLVTERFYSIKEYSLRLGGSVHKNEIIIYPINHATI